MLVGTAQEYDDTVVLVIRGNWRQLLCLFHNKYDFWTLPLGKADHGQCPKEAAAVEACEE